jgi:hypothetical protein
MREEGIFGPKRSRELQSQGIIVIYERTLLPPLTIFILHSVNLRAQFICGASLESGAYALHA